MRTRLFLAALCALASTMISTAATREYTCHRMAAAPVLDGNIDEEAWKNLPEATGFLLLGGKDFAVAKQTFFRAGWTDDSLYLAIKCVEPLLAKMNASTTDGDSIWSDDAVELFIAPTDANRYFQLIANSVGARWNAIGPDVKDTKPWGWEARPGKWDKGWLLEIKIPFKVLEKTPVDGEAWRVNVARDTTTGPAAERYSCWPFLQKGFNDLERFGAFIFKTDKSSAGATEKAEKKLNEPFFSYLRAQCPEKAKTLENPELNEALGNPSLAEEAALLKSNVAQLALIAGRKDVDPWEMAVALTTHRNIMSSLLEKAAKLNISVTKVPRHALTFELKTREVKDVALFVNGQSVKEVDAKLAASIREGLSVIGVSAVADGKNPGVKIRIVGNPETDGRWRGGTPSDDKWLAADFDDRSWKSITVTDDGYMWAAEPSIAKVCFRQLLLWNEKHYGTMPCLHPQVREWGFSEKSMETLFHVLYSPSPLSFPLENYEFLLDVPKGFSLLEEKYVDDSKGGRLNRRPQKVSTEEVKHDNRPYTRYRFAYESSFVQPNNRQCSLIPVMLGEFKEADKSCQFYFRRMASGNLTELEQTLPVRVLPPLNGRMPKKVFLEQYVGTPWRTFSGGRIFPEHLNAYMRQMLDVGFNCWFIGSWEGEFGKKVYEKVIERGGSVALVYNNYPLHGNNLGAKSTLGKWMQTAPESHARFFKDTSEWTKRGQYCPSFVNGEGMTQFKEAVKSDIGSMLHGGSEMKYIGMPKATIYWTDWEEVPWIAAGMGYEAARTGDGSYCFCDRCKKAFRQYAKLPDTTDLSDDAIWKNYKKEWNSFRYQLDGGINGIVREACNELGLKYNVYTGSHDQQFYLACKGKIDATFTGSPGDGRADAETQKHMDDLMTFFREKAGLPSIIGQLFASSYDEGGKINQRGGPTWEKDGFVNPRTLKPQILRVIASFHGGVDLHCAMERCAGQLYYIGEATRIISEFEDLFWEGERADGLAVSDQIKYPNLLVLKKGDERLILLFNESQKPMTVLLQNKDVKAGQKGRIYGSSTMMDNPGKMEVAIEPEDVAVVHIK